MLREDDYDDLNARDLPPRFLENLKVFGADVVAEHRSHLNTSYGYIVTSDRWNFHKFQQESMEINALRFSKVCFGQYFLVFPILNDHMTTEPLNYFILKSIAGGLISLWTERSFRDLRTMGDVNSTYVGNVAMPMNVVYFTYAWLLLLIGLGCSFMVFVLEVIYVLI